MVEPTFVEAVKAETAKVTDVDDWVETWHTSPERTDTLKQFLGFSDELYGEWCRNGDDALIGLAQ